MDEENNKADEGNKKIICNLYGVTGEKTLEEQNLSELHKKKDFKRIKS